MTTSHIEISATFPGEHSTPGVWCRKERRFIPKGPNTWLQWIKHMDEHHCDGEHVRAVQCEKTYIVLSDGEMTPT